MPVMDEIEAAKQLKRYPETREIPIIVLTASARISDMGELLKIGLDGYLTKPVRLPCLFGELSKWLTQTEKADPPRGDRESTEEPGRPAHRSYPAPTEMERIPELTAVVKTEMRPWL